ncbi:MAG: glycosyltransferase family 39 protein [Syntrophaceae bacterium]|nr:glycosyltransferase family 39 protein [Syntrophaceae bacterium]
MPERVQRCLVLWLIPVLLYLAPLPFMPLMEPDEGRYSSIPMAMNESGDYVTPRLKGTVYFEKPPLCYWATAVAFQIFGRNEFSSRLFVALCAWGCILLAYRVGSAFHDRRTGLYAAAVLSTFFYHAVLGRINILDMPLSLFVCLAIWSGYRYFASSPKERKKRHIYLLYFHSALAFLVKGLIGIVFPVGVVLLWLWLSRRWRETLRIFSPVGLALFAAVTFPWLILVQQANPDFFRFFFIQEHLLRYATRMHDRYEPFYFYLPVLLAGTLPWCAYLPEALRGLKARTANLFSDDEKRLLLVWLLLILSFFSLSSSKLIPYIAPVFIPLALIFGRLFQVYEQEGDQARSASLRCRWPLILTPLLFMAALTVPVFLERHQIGWGDWWPWITAPFLVLLLILVLPEALRRKRGYRPFWALYFCYTLFLVALICPASHFLSPYKSARPLAEAIRTHLPPGALCYQFGISLYGIDFYNGSRTPIVDDFGEVSYGSEQLPPEERDRYFLTADRFYERVRQEKTLYCATIESDDKTIRLAKLRKEFPNLTVLWHNSHYYLLKLTVP